MLGRRGQDHNSRDSNYFASAGIDHEKGRRPFPVEASIRRHLREKVRSTARRGAAAVEGSMDFEAGIHEGDGDERGKKAGVPRPSQLAV